MGSGGAEGGRTAEKHFGHSRGSDFRFVGFGVWGVWFKIQGGRGIVFDVLECQKEEKQNRQKKKTTQHSCRGVLSRHGEGDGLG